MDSRSQQSDAPPRPADRNQESDGPEARDAGEREGETASAEHRSGAVAIAGRPNVGKSTLLNRVLGQRLAPVTPKPQTTRKRLLGIKVVPGAQILFVDTPGLHRPRDLMNRRMVERARQAIDEADLILWVVDCRERPGAEDEEVAALLKSRSRPTIVALNKIDRLPRPQLLVRMEDLANLVPDAEIVPISALTGENVETLIRVIVERLPPGPRYYPEDELTDETERELVADIVREKVMLETRDEVPYDVAVTVDSFEDVPDRNLAVIRASIHVNRESQKPILLGRGGSRIKKIGQSARLGIEELLGRRVFLELFVRVRPGWTRDPRALKEFGL